VGDTNSRLCGMMVAGVEVEVASRCGGRRVTNRSITPRPASSTSAARERRQQAQ
jgi:hypothetical protein